MFSRPPHCADLENLLVSALLAAQPHNHTRELRYGDGLAPYYVLRAERDMRDRLAQPLTVASLANVAGVSERTLHDGFRRFRATTPMGRLTALRLAAARRRLQDATPGVTVGRIAIDVGFFQLGRFARIYRNAFGELPSATLQAARRRNS
jgi:transcriptional regulator GlxA family with amidase domain